MSIIASLAVLSLAASSVSAVTLTPSCISTLTTTLTAKPASECFATDSLLKFLPLALQNQNSSVVSTVDNYLAAVCPAPLCSNETVKATIDSLVGGCGEVVASFGISNATIAKYTPLIPDLKQIACIQTSNVTEAYNYTVTMPAASANATAANSTAAGNSSAYCISSTLAAIEKISGKSLTFSTITSLINKEMSLTSFINTTAIANATELLCTDCTKGLFTQIQSFANSSQFANATNNSTGGFVQEIKKFVTGVCGEQFLNGTLPATITKGSNTNQTTSSTTGKTGAAAVSFTLSPAVIAFAGVVGAMLI